MKMSTKGQYGVRAMFELAWDYGRKPISLKTVSLRQDLPLDYLEQLFTKLRKAGLVESVRGPAGGFLLAKRPQEITVGDIVKVLEGPLSPVACLDEGNTKKCNLVETCVARFVWKRLREKIEEALDSSTLEDLCKEARELKEKGDSASRLYASI